MNKLEERAVKCIFVGYSTSHSGDTYRMYNPETKRIVLSRDVKWAEFRKIDPKENMDMFIKYDSTDVVPGIDELVVEVKKIDEIDENQKVKIHVLPEEKNDKNVNVTKNSEMERIEPELNRLDRLEREMKKIDTSYNPTLPIPEQENQPIRDGNAVVTGNANIVPIEIPREEMADFCAEVHNTAVNSDVGDPTTFNGALSTSRGQMWRYSMISEVNNFLY